MSRRPQGDRGLAALELALVVTVVLAVAGVALPLPLALLEKTRLEQAAGRTVRWATSAPAGERAFSRTDDAAARRALVEREAEDALLLAGSRAPLVGVDLLDEPAPHCPLRRSRTVELRSEVDLGVLGSLLAQFPSGPADEALTITARATACEE